MQQCRDEFEIYNYQRIRLSNNKLINGILGEYASPGLTVTSNLYFPTAYYVCFKHEQQCFITG